MVLVSSLTMGGVDGYFIGMREVVGNCLIIHNGWSR